jgi:hypothetical protein
MNNSQLKSILQGLEQVLGKGQNLGLHQPVFSALEVALVTDCIESGWNLQVLSMQSLLLTVLVHYTLHCY